MMQMKHKQGGFYVLAPDEFSRDFRALGFDHTRKEVKLNWGPCTSYFKGAQDDFIRCVAQRADVESMVKLGFVVRVDRLPESANVNSKNNRKQSA